MTRAPVPGETIEVRPRNNIYTVLVIVATLVQFIALIVIYIRADHQFGGLLK
jgi:hypothetical protein